MLRSHHILPLAIAVLSATPLMGQIFSSQLLTNPGAEEGTTNGWSAFPVGGSPTYPSAANLAYSPGVVPHTGAWMFVGDSPGGGGGAGGLTQLVPLATVPNFTYADVDAGLVTAHVSFWQVSKDEALAHDTAFVRLYFLDGFLNPAGGMSSSILGGDDWQNESFSIVLPSGTRGLRYSIFFGLDPNGDNMIDAFIDDNSLILSKPVPEPATLALFASLVALAARRVWGKDRSQQRPPLT